MSGLVGYGSSDEEDETKAAVEQCLVQLKKGTAQSQVAETNERMVKASIYLTKPDVESLARPRFETADSSIAKPAEKVVLVHDNHTGNGYNQASESLSENTQDTLRNLTLPTVPNLDIPPSPPGSPPVAMSQKVARFLELKAQGVHFNEKLASSSSLKNQSLLGKLSAFAGLEHDDQYATSLPKDLFDPRGFPSWAYKEGLGRAQEQANKQREEQIAKGLRPGVEFVRASGNSSASTSARPSPATGRRGDRS